MTQTKSYEITICIFRRDELFPQDDTLLANTTLSFATVQAAIAWCDKAGVGFK